MKNKRRLLIIFARNPVKGSVKTRLAVHIGAEAALEIYLQLLKHVGEVTKEIQAAKEVHFSEAIPLAGPWNDYKRKLQKGVGLGERMEQAFKEGFLKGYRQIVLIGSDLPELTREDLKQAFEALDTNEYVLGPATDGGYYLIGMKSLNSELFRQITWGSSTVLRQTIEKIKNKPLSLLEKRRDLDTYEDLLGFPQFQQYHKDLK